MYPFTPLPSPPTADTPDVPTGATTAAPVGLPHVAQNAACAGFDASQDGHLEVSWFVMLRPPSSGLDNQPGVGEIS